MAPFDSSRNTSEPVGLGSDRLSSKLFLLKKAKQLSTSVDYVLSILRFVLSGIPISIFLIQLFFPVRSAILISALWLLDIRKLQHNVIDLVQRIF